MTCDSDGLATQEIGALVKPSSAAPPASESFRGEPSRLRGKRPPGRFPRNSAIRDQYIPPIPPPMPGPPGLAFGFSSGISLTMASVVKSSVAMLAAF